MNEKPKILMLNYLFPPLGGGGGVASYTIAKGFIQAGYGVDYVTTWFPGLKTFEIINGISVYRVKVLGRRDMATASLLSLICYPICALWCGIKLCVRNQYVLINSHFVVPTGPLGFFLSKIFKIKHVVSIHGGDIYNPTKKISPHRHKLLRMCITFLLNHADSILAQSADTRENCIKYYKPNHDIKIIPLPYETMSFANITKRELGLHEEKKYMIGIGMLVPRKGFDTFIKALAKLDDGVHGIIIGSGPELGRLKSLAQDLGVAQRLHLVGYVSDEKKWQYLSHADVFVLSSIHEGFGIVLQEAMQVGLPIVATNYGGQTDFITDGENGFLVPVSDEKSLADKVSQILNSKEIALRMKSNNLETIKKFSNEVFIKELFHSVDMHNGRAFMDEVRHDFTKSNKKVAIIIANWNGKRFLERCLRAVYNQTYKNFSIYFIDNGSTDGSVAYMQEYFPEVNVIPLKKNTGFAYANNVGIHTAFLDDDVAYILTLNNDTQMTDTCVSRLVEMIERDEKIGSVTPKIKYFDNENMIDSIGMLVSRDGGGISRGYKQIDSGQFDTPGEIFGASACAALYKREALVDIQYRREFFDNSFFAYYEDLDLAWRLRLRGWKSWSCPEALVLHVHSGTSISYSPFKAYHVNRNRFFLIVKDFPARYLLMALLTTPYRYLRLLNSMILKKSGPSYELKKKTSIFAPFFVVLKGWGSFLLHLPFLLMKRYTIQSQRKITSRDAWAIFDTYAASMEDMIYK